MVKPRTDLNDLLHTFCDNVYFQPPTGTSLSYPCIVYTLDNLDSVYADNAHYDINSRYTLTYITRDPDDENRIELVKLPMCRFDRHYKSDNLNHYVYTIYY